MLHVDFGILAAQLLTFGIALAIVWKVAWGPLTKTMRERQDKIRKTLEHAEQTRQAVAQLEQEYQFRLEQIQQKSNELIGLAKLEASRVRAEMLTSAKSEADQIRRKGEEQLVLERRRLADEVRSEIVNLSVAVAEKALKEIAGKDENNRRFEEMLRYLESGEGKAS